ncbi:hypothetical protein ACNKHW_24615 [Shigella flexneri]
MASDAISAKKDYRPHDDPDGERSGALSGGRHYRQLQQKRIWRWSRLGFPPFHGGAFRWLDTLGHAKYLDMAQRYQHLARCL